MSSLSSLLPAMAVSRARTPRPWRVASSGLDGPVFLGLEGLDLGLAVAHQAQRHRLHAARRAGAGQLAPQHGREREADEIVERPAGQIGLHQRRIDLARGLEGIEHGLLGDGVEGHPLDRHALLQGLLLLQDAQDVPGDGLSLAIGVGGQDQLVGVFDGRGDLLHHLVGAAVHVPVHLEVLVGLHRAVLGRQIAHVPVGRQHFVAGAQVFVDRLGLGDRFDNDDVHADVTRLPRPMPSGAAAHPCCWYFCPVAARTWWTKGAMSNQPNSYTE